MGLLWAPARRSICGGGVAATCTQAGASVSALGSTKPGAPDEKDKASLPACCPHTNLAREWMSIQTPELRKDRP